MVTNVLWRNDVTISITLSHRIGSNNLQSKQSMDADNKGSLTVWALYAYFSDSQNAAFELLVWCM